MSTPLFLFLDLILPVCAAGSWLSQRKRIGVNDHGFQGGAGRGTVFTGELAAIGLSSCITITTIIIIIIITIIIVIIIIIIIIMPSLSSSSHHHYHHSIIMPSSSS